MATPYSAVEASSWRRGGDWLGGWKNSLACARPQLLFVLPFLLMVEWACGWDPTQTLLRYCFLLPEGQPQRLLLPGMTSGLMISLLLGLTRWQSLRSVGVTTEATPWLEQSWSQLWRESLQLGLLPGLLGGLLLMGAASAESSWSLAVLSQQDAAAMGNSLGSFWHLVMTTAVQACGAGVYEEVVFRMLLLPAVVLGAFACGCSRRWSCGLGVVLSSVLFAGAHQIPVGDWTSFLSDGWGAMTLSWTSGVRLGYHFLAGMYLACIALWRGPAVAVGTHVCFDFGLTVLV